MIREWYNKTWSNGLKLSRDINSYKIYVKLFDPSPNDRHLDIGCGDGKLVHLMSRKIGDSTGIDISDVAIEKACLSGNGMFRQSDIENFDTCRRFSLISAIGSIEHCPDISTTLKKMYNLGINKAKYIIVVPNSNFIYWKIKRDKGTKQQKIGETLHSLEEWTNIFKKEGFIINGIERDPGRGKLTKLLTKFIPIKFTHQFIFMLTK